MKLYEFVDADGIYVARKANGTRLSPVDYRAGAAANASRAPGATARTIGIGDFPWL